MNSFYEKFSFLSDFVEWPEDNQVEVEQQLRAFYPQELFDISCFIGDKDFDTTIFIWIGFMFAQEAAKTSKLFKKTLEKLNALIKNNHPDLVHSVRQVLQPR